MSGGIPDTSGRFEALAAEFRDRPIGHSIVWRSSTESTMDDARRLAAGGAREGTVVGADEQSAGRGRHGREWVSRPGDDLLVSVVLRPDPATAGQLSVMAGLAAARAVDRLLGATSAIKWPNDVRVRGRKICGVLVETAVEGSKVAAVVGFGLNVNLDPTAWPEISATATSLAREAGRLQSREAALRALIAEMNRLYGPETSGPALRDQWAERVDTIGQRVELALGAETVRGLAEGVDYDGGLLVRIDGGGTRKFAAGEVTVQSPR
jgi:BirA family biotin operon repressor/biotin-[acetyl-CoA-carboxylase] ligase